MQDVEEQKESLAFSAEDFDAYTPEKWNSNMFTLNRRKVKSKLEEFGTKVQSLLESENLSLVMNLSDEFPSLWNKKQVDRQWLFFSRDEAARAELTDLIDKERTLADTLADPTPLFRHLFLGVAISESYMDIALRLHHDAWVDRKNLLSIGADDTRRQALIETISALPDHFQMGLVEEELSDVSDFDSEALEALTDEFATQKRWLFIGARLPKDQALVLGDDLVETVSETIASLIPLYKTIAWSPFNDVISIDNLVAERNEALRKSREELDKERAEREALLKEKEARGLALKQEIAEKVQEANAWRSREIAARRAQAARAQANAAEEDAKAKAEAMAAKWGLSDAPKKSDKADETRGKPAPAPRKPRSHDNRPPFAKKPKRPTDYRPAEARKPRTHDYGTASDGPISEGDAVVVTKGFLKGRRGKVQAIDEKGGLKVEFGALSSRLENDEVKGLGKWQGRGDRSDSRKRHKDHQKENHNRSKTQK